MLSKKNRLSRLEINQIKSKSNPTPTSLGLVYKISGKGKAAVIVSKKIDKRAIVRNSLRRRFYNSLKAFNFTNIDLIIYPSKSTLCLSTDNLGDKMSKFLDKK